MGEMMKIEIVVDADKAIATINGTDVLPLYQAIDDFAENLEGTGSNVVMMAALCNRIGVAAAMDDDGTGNTHALDFVISLISQSYWAMRGGGNA